MEREEVATDAKNEECVASVSKISSSCSLRHKRSKSASDRNLNSAKHGTLHFMGKDCNESKDSSNKVSKTSSNHRASLENDIKQLQMHLYQEKTIRYVLEKAIGRASSTLSPGHRHFPAQTRELIAEIELLEEEITNREQHVLSLYRSIFDQCISGPSSAQSSGMASPAHTKSGARKHPSIISSAFCSSKKFPLQPFQLLASIKESGKSNPLLKPKVRRESLSSENLNAGFGSNSSDPKKFPAARRNYLARTLKDHLYECPSKISEELVRCMAAIYFWVRSDSFEKPEKGRSPFLSRSSTSVILPRRGTADEQQWSSRSTVEISSISLDKIQFSSASYAINNYRLLVEQLERVDVSVLESSAKLAFWINIYNSLIMHAAYNIGGHIITANSIEYFILSCRTPRIGRWFETILSTAMRKKSGEEKQLLGSKFGVNDSHPLVLFALCTGASSDPMLRVYTAKNVTDELEKAKKEFLQANVVVKKSRKIFLPKILDRYAKETCIGSDDLLIWVSQNIDKKLQESIQKCIDSKNKRKASQVIEWLPYSTRFHYVFGKDLTEKPCWVEISCQ
ncbi:uncharacterized protein [Elaeis guineensis]|uniref:Uncharacterized protein LOC105053987 isoform X2 n=1 Tax=Elaeis guineensis var. tenera TaxID=51953 RepID=A0A6I9RXU6_ELAGV|nr:uncharacterized protein LOC105053987 isoform X2 [Elaeis guineensis]